MLTDNSLCCFMTNHALFACRNQSFHFSPKHQMLELLCHSNGYRAFSSVSFEICFMLVILHTFGAVDAGPRSLSLKLSSAILLDSQGRGPVFGWRAQKGPRLGFHFVRWQPQLPQLPLPTFTPPTHACPRQLRPSPAFLHAEICTAQPLSSSPRTLISRKTK